MDFLILKSMELLQDYLFQGEIYQIYFHFFRFFRFKQQSMTLESALISKPEI